MQDSPFSDINDFEYKPSFKQTLFDSPRPTLFDNEPFEMIQAQFGFASTTAWDNLAVGQQHDHSLVFHSERRASEEFEFKPDEMLEDSFLALQTSPQPVSRPLPLSS
jgi:hypothetical protein